MTMWQALVLLAFGFMFGISVGATEAHIKKQDWPKTARHGLLAFWWMGCILTYWSKLL